MANGELPRRKLGRTGIEVSALGLGGYHIGMQATAAESVRLIQHAVDEGIDFLDNCWDYNGGRSEERMGEALVGARRQQVFLMTKLDARAGDVALLQLEQSLARLRTDCIELVQIHEIIYDDDAAHCFAAGGIIEALVRAREQGKLRFIGFTGHKSPRHHLSMLDEAARQGFRFDAVQMPLNPLDHHFQSFEQLVLPRLVADGVAVLGMKSNGGGEMARAGKISPEEGLRYALGLPTSVVISGMDSLEVLEKNLAVARRFVPHSAAELSELLARSRAIAESGEFEPFKTTGQFDGTTANPHWLTEARV